MANNEKLIFVKGANRKEKKKRQQGYFQKTVEWNYFGGNGSHKLYHFLELHSCRFGLDNVTTNVGRPSSAAYGRTLHRTYTEPI